MARKWTGGIVAAGDGEGPPRVDEWVPVAVPGRPARFAGSDRIAYRTRFRDPRSRADQRVLLQLEGAYDRVEVWVNGERVGESDTHFAPSRFEFAPRPENELIVVCSASESCSGIYGTDDVPDELAVPGVWWSADLLVRPRTFVRNLRAVPRLTDEGGAIDVAVEVDAGSGVDESVTLLLRPDGFRGGGSMERVRVEAAAGERVTATKTLRVRDPSLWWPREYGPQHRYAVRAKLGDDAIDRTIGFRTVDRDEDGFVVNGRRIRARGFARLPGGDPRADVERAVDANATLLRARAHVPSHEFHAACDEAGVLVWQDLPISGPDLPVDRATALAETLVAEYGAHPSVATYGVQDEPIDPFADPLGSERFGSRRLDRLAFRWRRWRSGFDASDAERVAAAFPADVPIVPVTGSPGIGADAATLYPGWRYLEATDVDWLLDRYPSLASAVGGFGAGSLAVDERDATGGREAIPGPGELEAIPGLDRETLERRSTDVDDSRDYQARTLETVADALRRRGVGIVVGPPIRDAAPGGGTGVLERDGSEKPAYGALASAYEPVRAVLDESPAPGTVGITLVNDGRNRIETTVAWSAGDRSGKESVTAEPLESVPAGAAEVPTGADRLDLGVSVNGRTVRNRYHL